MDTVQAFLTTAATVVEYFFFTYLAVALLVDAFKVQALEPGQKGFRRSHARSTRLSHSSTLKAAGSRSPATTAVSAQPATLVAAS